MLGISKVCMGFSCVVWWYICLVLYIANGKVFYIFHSLRNHYFLGVAAYNQNKWTVLCTKQKTKMENCGGILSLWKNGTETERETKKEYLRIVWNWYSWLFQVASAWAGTYRSCTFWILRNLLIPSLFVSGFVLWITFHSPVEIAFG